MKQAESKQGKPFLSLLRKLGYLSYSIGMLFVSIFVLGVVIIWLLQSLGMSQSLSGTLASQLSIGLYGVILFKLKKDNLLEPFKEFSFKVFWYGVRITVLILLINIIISNILVVNTESLPESTQSIVSQRSFLLTFLLPVIVAPIFEELSFRAGLKYLLVDRGKFHNISYILISSIIFGLLHWTPGAPTALAHITLTGIMGIIYSFMYIKTDNIYIPIVSHMFYNGLVITAASFI